MTSQIDPNPMTSQIDPNPMTSQIDPNPTTTKPLKSFSVSSTSYSSSDKKILLC